MKYCNCSLNLRIYHIIILTLILGFINSLDYGTIAYFEKNCPDGWEELIKDSSNVKIGKRNLNYKENKKKLYVGELSTKNLRITQDWGPVKSVVEEVAENLAAAKNLTAEEPGTEEPVTEDPAAEKLVVEETAAVKPVVEEPAAEEPAAEEPAAEEPASEEPDTERPVTEDPAAEKPVVEEPAAEKPAVEEPAAEEPAVEEPASEEPAAEQPAEQPIAEHPNVEQPIEVQSSQEKLDQYLVQCRYVEKIIFVDKEQYQDEFRKYKDEQTCYNVISILTFCFIIIGILYQLILKVVRYYKNTGNKFVGQISSYQNSAHKN